MAPQINISSYLGPPPPLVNNANFSTEAHTTKSAAYYLAHPQYSHIARAVPASVTVLTIPVELVGCVLLLKLALLTPVLNAPRLIDAPVTTAPSKY